MSKKAVVFSADLSYMEKLETAMKSLCAHQDQLKIYVLNEDLPTEWFAIMNQRLRQLDSEVINCRMSPEQFQSFSLPSDHIHYATYFRYAIPEFVKEDQQVYGDQGILNLYFKDAWFPLPWTYNLQVGSDKDQYLYGDLDWYDAFQGIPAVIHYTSHNKPWTSKRFNRFREQWWFYYALSWEEVLLRKPILKQTYQDLVGEFPYHAAIYTHTADIHELEMLLKELPDVAIHVLAHSHFGFNLVQLERYPNLFLYPSFDPLTSRKVLEKLDFYLDINPYDEVDQMTQRIHQLGLPIFSFEGTNHVENGVNQVFADDQVQEMVAAIRDYLKRNEKKHGNK